MQQHVPDVLVQLLALLLVKAHGALHVWCQLSSTQALNARCGLSVD
jgi:hypothetical protein